MILYDTVTKPFRMYISLYYFFLATNTITNTKKERERENTVLIVPTILFQDVFVMKEMI